MNTSIVVFLVKLFPYFFALLKCELSGSNKNVSESRIPVFLELWGFLKVLLPLSEYRDTPFLYVFQIVSSLDISNQQVKFEGKFTVNSISVEFP